MFEIFTTLGREYRRRAVTIRLGSARRPVHVNGGKLLCGHDQGHMSRLRSLQYFQRGFGDACWAIVGAPGSGVPMAPCPALRMVRLDLTAAAERSSHDEASEYAGAATLITRLPKSCSLLACGIIGSRRDIDRVLDVLARALCDATHVGIETLAVLPDKCVEDEGWRLSAAAGTLEAACQARSVALDLRA